MSKPKHWFYGAVLISLCLAPGKGLLGASSRKEFDQAVADLQKNPQDRVLRGRIIDLYSGLAYLPDLPADVPVLMSKGAYLFESAKSDDDFKLAWGAYKQAALEAPWDGDLYYKLGVVEEKLDLPGDALADYRLYLQAKPEAKNRANVEARFGRLSAELDKVQTAAADASAQETLAKRQAPGLIVGILGGLAVTGGGIGWLVSLPPSSPGGTSYTQAQGPQVYQGVAYNKLYDGHYYTASDYNDFIAAQASSASSQQLYLTITLVGAVATVVGIIMYESAGSAPAPAAGKRALLDVDGGKVAMGLPGVDLNPRLDGLQATLLHAQF
jgi:hypothetical protein